MKQFRCWLFLVFLLSALFSCRSGFETLTLKKTDISPFLRNDGNALVYRTTIDFFRNHFSGILVCKQTDIASSHLVFITEIGMKIFDFEVRGDSLRLVYAFPGFESRPKAISLLQSDFSLIFLNGIYGKTAQMKADTVSRKTCFRIPDGKGSKTYWVSSGSGSLIQAIQNGLIRKKTVVDYGEYKDGRPCKIRLKHKGIRLRIEMNILEKE